MEMDIDIKILGPGCKKCGQVAEMVRQVIEEHGFPAQIEEIAGLDKIAEYGVLSTPAVVIGGDVKCSGRVPERHEILQWLRKYQGTPE
ncbi:MAG: thioredoxin family protein [Desulfurivibrionaceae bacterium]